MVPFKISAETIVHACVKLYIEHRVQLKQSETTVDLDKVQSL